MQDENASRPQDAGHDPGIPKTAYDAVPHSVPGGDRSFTSAPQDLLGDLYSQLFPGMNTGHEPRPDAIPEPPHSHAETPHNGDASHNGETGSDEQQDAENPESERLINPYLQGARASSPDFEDQHQEARVAPPRSPTNLIAAGISPIAVAELILKALYLNDHRYGSEIALELRLPFQVVESPLRQLKDDKLVEVPDGATIGPASYRFQLTQAGRARARDAFQRCSYVGPAPVPLREYEQQCRRQTVSGLRCSPKALIQAFKDIIIRENLLTELGPAVCSGRSIFLYGPPGNGKSMIARGLGNYLNHFGGEIYVPYAIEAEGAIITLFDPTLHHAVDHDAVGMDNHQKAASAMLTEMQVDGRWRRIRRPIIITGGELTLDMLDLRYNHESNIHTAPLHVKANGGVFLIDDFGRQIVSPRDLLNRWILPLEERIDYLTPVSGRKFSVPFEQLIIFSTNLDPRELVDEAFLRRIRNKIKIGAPSRELFIDVFRFHCERRKIPYSPEAVEFLFSNFYDRGKTPRCSDARDLLETIISICRYENRPVRLTSDLMATATKRFFCQL
ncbi:ATPase [Calycomorphotria hydatis]|uniref:AAA+ ATPase domain-containing protein n=1 Tax=Calycomorphotria hydatis TaxID=2528027 RepID=A0A517T5K4_9PLAN|nr:ATPase [Calycomorphotria hydatis]QDT63666.1 hypothetical protein V22_08900 [Calycomorphotria hydatis]